MKLKSFLPQLVLAINLIFLLLQLFAMDSFGLGFEFPILSLVVPLLCLINFIFFIYWTLRLKWPSLLFLIAFAWSFESAWFVF